MEKFSHVDEPVPTLYVNRGGHPVRINRADWDGKEPIHEQSHFVPEGATVTEETKSTGKGGKGKTATDDGKGSGGGNMPKLVGSPKSWQGVNGLIYTQADEAGKFWRVDDKSVVLLDTPFDTDALAAAATVTA